MTRIVNDVPPYMIVEGNPSRVRGYNETGMRRWGLTDKKVQAVRQAYRLLFSQRAENSGRVMNLRLAEVEANVEMTDEVRHLCHSIGRSMHDGVFGRYLEHTRRDTDRDREGYYRRRAAGENLS